MSNFSTSRNVRSIIRLPILHCKSLQLKGFVPVLVLLRMIDSDSDSDIYSRRPLFWAPVDGEALGPHRSTTCCGELSTGNVLPRLSSTASCSYSALLVNIAAAFRVQYNSAVQRLAKHCWTDLGSAEGNVQICGVLSCCVFQDYRSRVLASEMAYATGVGILFLITSHCRCAVISLSLCFSDD